MYTKFILALINLHLAEVISFPFEILSLLPKYLFGTVTVYAVRIRLPYFIYQFSGTTPVVLCKGW